MNPTRDGWGTGLWRQAQQVRIDRDGTLRAPVRANGKDGVRVGDPPFDVTSADVTSGTVRKAPTAGEAPSPRPGLLQRLKRRLGIG